MRWDESVTHPLDERRTGDGRDSRVPFSEDAGLQTLSSLSSHDRAALERFAYEWGNATEAYDLATVDGLFLQTACGTGAVRVISDGQFWHVPGGIVGPDRIKHQMVCWLRELAEHQKRSISVYSVPENEAPLFLAEQFEVSKLGEEAVLPLGEIAWRGRQFDWVRRQSNYCRRAGLQVVELIDDDVRQACADELLAIQRDDLSGRPYSKPIGILEADFNPRMLLRRRVFVARRAGSGSIESFLACAPMQNGTQWAFETYRKTRQSTRGVVAFLFREVIDRLQREGVEQVSLCIVPGRGVADSCTSRDNWLKRQILSCLYRRWSWLFNVRGQELFKSHFHPVFVGRYVCVTPRTTVGSFLSFLKMSGGMRPDVKNLLRSFWRHCVGKHAAH